MTQTTKTIRVNAKLRKAASLFVFVAEQRSAFQRNLSDTYGLCRGIKQGWITSLSVDGLETILEGFTREVAICCQQLRQDDYGAADSTLRFLIATNR